jgi:hypothetical protein
MVTSPAVSWLFFKARAKRPYLNHTGRASNAEKQPTGPGPEGCVENGPAAALLVGYVSIQICALLAPCRRPILNATTSPLFARRYTRSLYLFGAGVKSRSQEPENARTQGARRRTRGWFYRLRENIPAPICPSVSSVTSVDALFLLAQRCAGQLPAGDSEKPQFSTKRRTGLPPINTTGCRTALVLRPGLFSVRRNQRWIPERLIG